MPALETDLEKKTFSSEDLSQLISDEMKKRLGITIEELNRAILKTLDSGLMLGGFDVTKDSFKKAEKTFLKTFLTFLAVRHYGNVSAIARASGKDRKTILILAKKVGVNFDSFRQDMMNPLDYLKKQVKQNIEVNFRNYEAFLSKDLASNFQKGIPDITDTLVSSFDMESLTLDAARDIFEKSFLQETMIVFKDVKTAAKAIGMNERTLYHKLQKYGLN